MSKILNKAEASQVLGLSLSTLNRRLRNGDIPKIVLSRGEKGHVGRVGILEEDVEKYIELHRMYGNR
jgi:predicted site-specific integrase-resolvase